jgi:membrane-associated phospholipid phosphatase
MTLRKSWLVGLAAVACVGYAAMWLGWALEWRPVVGFDASSLDALHRYGAHHLRWLHYWNLFCTVFGPLGFRVIASVPIALALLRRRWRVAGFLFVTVELSGLLTELAKAAAGRPRPASAFVIADSTSFPSGHALCSMAGVLALGVVLLPLVRASLRPWLIALGALLVVAVGFGRVVLNVHNPSDVLAGWALGYLYFALCLLVFRPGPLRVAGETPAALGNAP